MIGDIQLGARDGEIEKASLGSDFLLLMFALQRAVHANCLSSFSLYRRVRPESVFFLFALALRIPCRT